MPGSNVAGAVSPGDSMPPKPTTSTPTKKMDSGEADQELETSEEYFDLKVHPIVQDPGNGTLPDIDETMQSRDDDETDDGNGKGNNLNKTLKQKRLLKREKRYGSKNKSFLNHLNKLNKAIVQKTTTKSAPKLSRTTLFNSTCLLYTSPSPRD